MAMNFFTKKEDDYIREHSGKQMDKYIAHVLERPVSSVRNRKRKLGIKRDVKNVGGYKQKQTRYEYLTNIAHSKGFDSISDAIGEFGGVVVRSW